MAWWRRTRDERTSAAVRQTDLTRAQTIVRLEGITKVFRSDDADEETRALSDVTLDIQRGEYVSVSGPSGCGKSTFLSILALLETPTAGRYWLNGRATDTFSAA